jgi:hypothetical protein
MTELDYSIHQVAHVLEQIIIIRADKLFPLELGIVTAFRTPGQKIISPDIRIETRIFGAITEDTDSSRLAELAAFIAKVLCCRDMLNLRPIATGSELRSRKHLEDS